MKSLFKIMLLVAAIVCVSNVSAQEKGMKAFGGGLTYLTDEGYSNTGVNLKFQYNLTDPIRLEPSVTFFLPKDKVNSLDLSLNAHYLFSLNDDFMVYPLVGFGVMRSSSEGYSNSDMLLNLGAGIDYWITDNLIGNFEIKLKSANTESVGYSWYNVSVGVAYVF
ncbi:hypothetical protein AGMMS50239_15750 [Bacteroidia bacterium]|nr:hypothetical protein AGMMS50239_15750 [Bacteroidia bacterium]